MSRKVGIRLFAGSIGLALLAAVASLLVWSDSSGCGSCLRVSFLGTAPSSTDRTFVRFQQALVKRQSNRVPRFAIQHVPVSEVSAQAMAQDLLTHAHLPADVFVAMSASNALAVNKAVGASKRALLFASFPDPVRYGLVDKLQLPGNRTTGVWLGDRLHGKRLEILRDAFPRVQVVGVLVDRGWMGVNDLQTALMEPALALGLEIRLLVAEDEAETIAAMQTDANRSVDAWYIPPTYVGDLALTGIVRHLAQVGKPSMHSSESDVAAGALMAYSQDTSFVYDALADLTIRVLRGEDPGTIPIQFPKRFLLSVRPRDHEVALRIHPAVVRRADRIY